MAKVIVKEYNSFDSALKAFTQKCFQEGLGEEFRKRDHYVSKGEKRRAKKLEALRKIEIQKRKQQKDNDRYN